jgi:hypothetical protein
MKTRTSHVNLYGLRKTFGSNVSTVIIIMIFLALSSAPPALSQIPQGFNYQALARDETGDPIIRTELPVMITIQADSLGKDIIWKELHSNITTNDFGLINLIVGKGEKQPESTIRAFSDIDWSITPKFIKTEVDYKGWKEMGVTRLWSVPYAMVADSLSTPFTKLLVEGETTSYENPLFEVKNKDGYTVFAVYNEGVRVYVGDGEKKGPKGGFSVGGFGSQKDENNKQYLFVDDDSVRIYVNDAGKSSKGGFAIGGFGYTKEGIQKYFYASEDSVRVYIDDTGKGAKGGFAIGGFGHTKGNANFLDISTDVDGIVDPPENRILWYPLKNAFLTGNILITSPLEVGENSFASGYQAKAQGQFSQSMGYLTQALGDYSTAIGKNAVATQPSSFAFGDGASANMMDSYAFGAGALASGTGSYAFGSMGRDTLTFEPNTQPTEANGDYAFAIGLGATASGISSTAIGNNSSASGENSMALGVFSDAQGAKSTAINAGEAIGNYSFASGLLSKAEGDFSVAIGHGSTKFGTYNHALGYGSTALGYSRAYGGNSVAVGTATVNGNYAYGLGHSVTVNGDYAIGIGILLTAESYRSIAVGSNCIISGNPEEWIWTDPLFVVGNGTSPSSPSNALTILKNGNTGIGTDTPTQVLDVDGNARFRSIGSGAYVGQVNRTSDGTLTIASSDIRLKENIATLHGALEAIMKLRGVTFTWKDDPELGERVGLIAQEVEPVLPELVFTNEVDGFKGINYSEMTAVLIEAVKEQQSMIESQQQQIDRLERLVEELMDEE